jgi:hypothetical protein
MTKFKINHDNQVIEFETFEKAQNYKNINDIVSEIVSFEEGVFTPQTYPQSVTPRQMRIALVLSGISLATIEGMIESLPEPQRSITRITWEYSIEFQRNNQLLVSMAPALGLTEVQVDDLFLLASTL